MWPDRKTQRVQLFVEPVISKSLIRKAASQVVSAGNELVSSEVLEFVGIVVFFVIIQLSTSVALLPPQTDFSGLRSARSLCTRNTF